MLKHGSFWGSHYKDVVCLGARQGDPRQNKAHVAMAHLTFESKAVAPKVGAILVFSAMLSVL